MIFAAFSPVLQNVPRAVSCLLSWVSGPFGSRLAKCLMHLTVREAKTLHKIIIRVCLPCLSVASGPSRPAFQSTHGRAQPCSPACPALASSNSSASQSELSSSCTPGFPLAPNTFPHVGSSPQLPSTSLRQISPFLLSMCP